MANDYDVSLEASDLGWQPGECAPSVCWENEDYLFESVVRRRNSEVTGWRFATATGKKLMIYNDC